MNHHFIGGIAAGAVIVSLARAIALTRVEIAVARAAYRLGAWDARRR